MQSFCKLSWGRQRKNFFFALKLIFVDFKLKDRRNQLSDQVCFKKLHKYSKIKTLTLTKTSTCILESIPLYSVTSKSKTSRFVSISNDYFQYRKLWLKILTVYNCSTNSFDKLASITKFWRISMTDDSITVQSSMT